MSSVEGEDDAEDFVVAGGAGGDAVALEVHVVYPILEAADERA